MPVGTFLHKTGSILAILVWRHEKMGFIHLHLFSVRPVASGQLRFHLLVGTDIMYLDSSNTALHVAVSTVNELFGGQT